MSRHVKAFGSLPRALLLGVMGVLMTGCGTSGDNGSGSVATNAAPVVQAAAVARAAFSGTWSGTAWATPLVRAGLAHGSAPFGMMLPLADLGGFAAVLPIVPFGWTISCIVQPSGSVIGTYSDTAGRTGGVSGTTMGEMVAVSVNGIDGTTPFIISFTGMLSLGFNPGDLPNWEITQASLARDGEAPVGLTAEVHQVQQVPQAPEASAPVVQPDAVLIEEDILDP